MSSNVGESCCTNWLATFDPDLPGYTRIGYPPAWYYSSFLGLLSLTKAFFRLGARSRPTVGSYQFALTAAAARGHATTIRYLLENNLAQIDESNGHHPGTLNVPLDAAMFYGHFSVIKILVQHGTDIIEPSQYFRVPPLHWAVAGGRLDWTQYFLEKGADVNYLTPNLGTALGEACRQGNVAIVKLLLDWGARLEWSGDYDTSLQMACFHGNTEVVSFLLKEGANVHAEGKLCGNALQCACLSRETSSVDIARLLIAHGADINAKPGRSGTALQCAVFGVREAWPKLRPLLSSLTGPFFRGFSMRETGDFDNISEGLVKLLLEEGAEVNTAPGGYGTALQAARAKGHEEIVELLLTYGAKDIPVGEIGEAEMYTLEWYRDRS